jgi:hypothetical protein
LEEKEKQRREEADANRGEDMECEMNEWMNEWMKDVVKRKPQKEMEWMK